MMRKWFSSGWWFWYVGRIDCFCGGVCWSVVEIERIECSSSYYGDMIIGKNWVMWNFVGISDRW